MQGYWIYSEEYGNLVTNKCSLCGQTMTTYELLSKLWSEDKFGGLIYGYFL